MQKETMKVTVIGAGNVGATVADCVARKDMVGEVVLIDIPDKADYARGKALDMYQAAPIHGFDTRITGGADYGLTEGSQVCVITAGLPRRPGMSRSDLLKVNGDIVRSVTEQFVKGSPDSIIVVVSNPLDVMTWVALETSGFTSNRVMGMAGVLDTARYRAFLALELGCSVRDIQALLMGGHGDSMVPLPRFTTVGGMPVTEMIPEEKLASIVERTKVGGGEIVKLMGTSAWYAPGAGAAEMVEAIVKDNGRVLPCAVWMKGHYGLNDLFIGAPARLGKNGVEEIIEVQLSDDERSLLHASAGEVRKDIDALQEMWAA
jgi:malate dehydrogenase